MDSYSFPLKPINLEPSANLRANKPVANATALVPTEPSDKGQRRHESSLTPPRTNQRMWWDWDEEFGEDEEAQARRGSPIDFDFFAFLSKPKVVLTPLALFVWLPILGFLARKLTSLSFSRMILGS